MWQLTAPMGRGGSKTGRNTGNQAEPGQNILSPLLEPPPLPAAPWPPGRILICPLPLGTTHTRSPALCNGIWLAEHGSGALARGYLTPFLPGTGGRAFPPTYLPNRRSVRILGNLEDKYLLYSPLTFITSFVSHKNPEKVAEQHLRPILPTRKLRLRESN